VIVDDGSTDATADVADTLSRESHHPRQGDSPGQPVVQAQPGRGVWMRHGANSFQFLDSDGPALAGKVFPPRLLPCSAGLSVASATDPSAEENHASNPPGRDCPMRATGELIDHLFPRLLTERWWTTSSPLYRRTLLDQIGPWQAVDQRGRTGNTTPVCGSTGTRLVWVNELCSIRRINLKRGAFERWR